MIENTYDLAEMDGRWHHEKCRSLRFKILNDVVHIENVYGRPVDYIMVNIYFIVFIGVYIFPEIMMMGCEDFIELSNAGFNCFLDVQRPDIDRKISIVIDTDTIRDNASLDRDFVTVYFGSGPIPI